jgi:hypothetical protein
MVTQGGWRLPGDRTSHVIDCGCARQHAPGVFPCPQACGAVLISPYHTLLWMATGLMPAMSPSFLLGLARGGKGRRTEGGERERLGIFSSLSASGNTLAGAMVPAPPGDLTPGLWYHHTSLGPLGPHSSTSGLPHLPYCLPSLVIACKNNSLP